MSRQPAALLQRTLLNCRLLAALPESTPASRVAKLQSKCSKEQTGLYMLVHGCHVLLELLLSSLMASLWRWTDVRSMKIRYTWAE